jgi:hypothetical protein
MHHDPIVAKRKPTRLDEYLYGVPNGDIPYSVWQALTDAQKDLARTSGYWEVRSEEAVLREARGPKGAEQGPAAQEQPPEALGHPPSASGSGESKSNRSRRTPGAVKE